MMENVSALLNDDRLRQVERELVDRRYSCMAQVLNAEDFGVPQRRLRMIMMGSRQGCPPFAIPDDGAAPLPKQYAGCLPQTTRMIRFTAIRVGELHGFLR